MTLQEALERLHKALADAGIPDAHLEAELLLAHVAGSSRARLYAYRERSLTLEQKNRLARLLERRLKREPLAYILSRREFFGLEFVVRQGVLIPRPETELLVERACRLARQVGERQKECWVADVGTGCGNVAVSLAVRVPCTRIYGTETSAEALEVAGRNVRRHGVASRVHLLPGALLAPLPGPVDVIVANLPYAPSDRLPQLQTEVQWEPRQALDGGPDGLDVVRRLLEQAPKKLNEGGYLLLEMDPQQREPLAREVLCRFPGATLEVERDLAGHERLLIMRTT